MSCYPWFSRAVSDKILKVRTTIQILKIWTPEQNENKKIEKDYTMLVYSKPNSIFCLFLFLLIRPKISETSINSVWSRFTPRPTERNSPAGM